MKLKQRKNNNPRDKKQDPHNGDTLVCQLACAKIIVPHLQILVILSQSV